MRKNKRNCACVCASVRCLRVRFLLAEFLETSITAQSICSGASRLDGRQRHRKWMRQPHPPPTPKSPKKREMSRRISATANRPSSLSLPTMEREREREREPNPRRGRTRRNRGKTSFCCCCFFFFVFVRRFRERCDLGVVVWWPKGSGRIRSLTCRHLWPPPALLKKEVSLHFLTATHTHTHTHTHTLASRQTDRHTHTHTNGWCTRNAVDLDPPGDGQP